MAKKSPIVIPIMTIIVALSLVIPIVVPVSMAGLVDHHRSGFLDDDGLVAGVLAAADDSGLLPIAVILSIFIDHDPRFWGVLNRISV